jgi:hypothetical protein
VTTRYSIVAMLETLRQFVNTLLQRRGWIHMSKRNP